MRWPILLLTAVPVAFTQGGCIAFPFATPPLRISVSGEARKVVPAPAKMTTPAALHLDAGIHPLQILPTQQRRRGDVGLGYMLDTGSKYTLHGAYVEGAVFPLMDDLGRFGVHMQPRLLFEGDTGRAGFGMGLRLSGELRGLADGPFSSSDSQGGAVGYAYGEAGIGIYLEGGLSRVGERNTFNVGFGVSARLPAMAGIAWVFWR